MRAAALACKQIDHEAQHFAESGFLQHDIERCVGSHAAVAQQPSVDLDRGEKRQHRARRKDMLRAYVRAPACVEDHPFSCYDVGRDDADPNRAAV